VQQTQETISKTPETVGNLTLGPPKIGIKGKPGGLEDMSDLMVEITKTLF
jgi:hypothetical protein